MSKASTATITDDWLPLPDTILGGVQWRNGDVIEFEVLDSTHVLLTRRETVALPIKKEKKTR